LSKDQELHTSQQYSAQSGHKSQRTDQALHRLREQRQREEDSKRYQSNNG
jgi:hypothetical protein